VYGWRVTDGTVIRDYSSAPKLDKTTVRYKAYVALHERKYSTATTDVAVAPKAAPPGQKAAGTKEAPPSTEAKKPLIKRLFFWK